MPDSERRAWRAGGVSGAAIRAERRPLRKRGRPAPRPGIARWSATPYLGPGRPPRADHIPAALVGRTDPLPGWNGQKSGAAALRPGSAMNAWNGQKCGASALRLEGVQDAMGGTFQEKLVGQNAIVIDSHWEENG